MASLSTETKTAFKFRPNSDVAIIKRTITENNANKIVPFRGTTDSEGFILIDNELLKDCYVEFHKKEGSLIYHAFVEGKACVPNSYFNVSVTGAPELYWEMVFRTEGLRNLSLPPQQVNLGTAMASYSTFQKQMLIVNQIAEGLKNSGYDAVSVQPNFLDGYVKITVREYALAQYVIIVLIVSIIQGLVTVSMSIPLTLSINALNQQQAKMEQLLQQQSFEETRQKAISEVQSALEQGLITKEQYTQIMETTIKQQPPTPQPTPTPTPQPSPIKFPDLSGLFSSLGNIGIIFLVFVFLVLISVLLGNLYKVVK